MNNAETAPSNNVYHRVESPKFKSYKAEYLDMQEFTLTYCAENFEAASDDELYRINKDTNVIFGKRRGGIEL